MLPTQVGNFPPRKNKKKKSKKTPGSGRGDAKSLNCDKGNCDNGHPGVFDGMECKEENEVSLKCRQQRTLGAMSLSLFTMISIAGC